MKKYEEKPIQKIEKTLTKIECDVCKKEIIKGEHYYEIVTGHNDWGADSDCSREEKDICSNECLQKEFDKYLECKNNSKYIEISREKNV